jgi:hypothetical protein
LGAEAGSLFCWKEVRFKVKTMDGRSLNSLQKLQPGSGAIRAALFMTILLFLPPGGAQSHIGGLPQPIGQGVGDPALGTVNGYPDDPDQARRLRLLNAERQKSLVADTVKLLKLANELNAVLTKEDASAPTQAELRKVADIEKLAHNVKEKMKITVIGTPIYRNSSLPQGP